jgi:lipopolysaccharide transport system permease protein
MMPLPQYLGLIDMQARMALKSDASKNALGYLWWVLEPLLYVGVFYVVFNLILSSNRSDFLVFLMCGKLAFIWFSKTINQASNSIVGGKGLIGKIDIPKSMFPMVAALECLYRQVVVFSLLIVVVIAYDYSPSLVWFWLIPLVIVNYIMILACSFLGAYLVCFVQDFSKLIPLVMVFMMFTSGIFWDVRDLGDPEKTQLVLALNPLAFMLDGYRQVLMYQTAPDLGHLVLIGVGFGALLLLMFKVLHKYNHYLALKALTT